MNELPLSPPPAAEPRPAPAPKALEERLAHLFRASRRCGLIHPLEHLVLQLRSETAAAASETPR